MRERTKEFAAVLPGPRSSEDSGAEVAATIAEVSEPDRTTAKGLHALIRDTAPIRVPRTWYGMPAHAKHDYVLCFLQNGAMITTRHSTRDSATRCGWATARGCVQWTPRPTGHQNSRRIAAQVTRAVR